MEQDLITVIIPVYNSEKYFGKCIESILNQTYQNIEIIIINDCSTDESENIILDYLGKDNRITYLSNETNLGVGKTRNIGIDRAKGKYIYFIDSDDYIEESTLADLHDAIQEGDSFCCMMQAYRTIDGKDYLFSRSKEELSLLRSPSVCFRLFNKNFLDQANIRFSGLPIGEDLEFVFKLMVYNNQYSYVTKPLYHYVIHSDSSSRGSIQKQFSIFEVLSNMENYAKSLNRYDQFYKEIEFLYISHGLRGTMRRIMQLPFQKEDIVTCFRLVEQKYPNWQNNEYLKQYLSGDFKFLIEARNSLENEQELHRIANELDLLSSNY